MAKTSGTSKPSVPFVSAANTSRLTENKRRYRQRRKDYITDIERRLAEAREKGIEATKEVQTAARQVALENGRLRQLLQLAGFEVKDIDFWSTLTCATSSEDTNQDTRIRQIESQARQCAAIVPVQQEKSRSSDNANSCNGRSCKNGSINPGISNTRVAESNLSAEVGSDTMAMPQPKPPMNGDCPISQHTDSVTRAGMPPCRLLSRLAENPAADITQDTELTNEEKPLSNTTQQEGGVECKKAYQMLMRYATSEERIDYIAQALEAGCSADGKGGCSVKSKVVLQALDGMCG